MTNDLPSEPLYETPEQKWVLFPVSIGKLILLSFATWSGYLLYWSYRNFKWLETSSGVKQRPVLNSIFLAITLYHLIKKINAIGKQNKMSKSLLASLLAIAFFLLQVAAKLPDPYWTVSFLNIIPIVIVQMYINEINKKTNPNVPINSRIGIIQWIFIIPGITSFFAFILAMIVNPQYFQ